MLSPRRHKSCSALQDFYFRGNDVIQRLGTLLPADREIVIFSIMKNKESISIYTL